MQKKVVAISNGNRGDVQGLAELLKANGFSFEAIELSKGEPLPKSLEDLSALLILGGPITVYDQDTSPFLKVCFNM